MSTAADRSRQHGFQRNPDPARSLSLVPCEADLERAITTGLDLVDRALAARSVRRRDLAVDRWRRWTVELRRFLHRDWPAEAAIELMVRFAVFSQDFAWTLEELQALRRYLAWWQGNPQPSLAEAVAMEVEMQRERLPVEPWSEDG